MGATCSRLNLVLIKDIVIGLHGEKRSGDESGNMRLLRKKQHLR